MPVSVDGHTGAALWVCLLEGELPKIAVPARIRDPPFFRRLDDRTPFWTTALPHLVVVVA